MCRDSEHCSVAAGAASGQRLSEASVVFVGYRRRICQLIFVPLPLPSTVGRSVDRTDPPFLLSRFFLECFALALPELPGRVLGLVLVHASTDSSARFAYKDNLKGRIFHVFGFCTDENNFQYLISRIIIIINELLWHQF